MTMNQEGYPVFKGLQKPLEFMGIRGRFLTLAAAAIGVSFVGFIGFSIALGKVAGFIAMMVMALVGLITIYIKQRGGLHNKKRHLYLQKPEKRTVNHFIQYGTQKEKNI